MDDVLDFLSSTLPILPATCTASPARRSGTKRNRPSGMAGRGRRLAAEAAFERTIGVDDPEGTRRLNALV